MTPPNLGLRVGLYLLVADGVAALYFADFLGVRGTAVVALLVAATWPCQVRSLRSGAPLPGARLVVPAAAAAALADIVYYAETALDGLVRLLLFLVLYKLAMLRTIADTRTIAFLAFFMLVASSTTAFGIGYFFAFVVFVAVVSWVALVQHVAVEREAQGGEVDAIPTRALLALAAVSTAGVFVVAGGLFFALPRIGLAALPLRARLGNMVTGFSDRVELGAYGSILTDSRVVMRVHLPDEPRPDLLPGLRWRGVALDAFDGRVWSVQHPRWIRLVHQNAGQFEVGALRGTGRILRQEVFLEPIGAEAVFAAPHPLRVTLPALTLVVDDMGVVSVPSASARLRYTVESEIEGVPGRRGRVRPAPPLHPIEWARYLQLPPLGADVHDLARTIAGGSHDPAEVAARIEQYLAREFRYTLDIERVSDLDPLREFLFVRRAGHCEYFAAAMAVLLRTLGIPSRVVNGFQRGEWNPYGGYFMVRYLDAHSWVEAYLPGRGWTTFDPTPRATAATQEVVAPAFLYLDALRLQWHRYVINWSLRDQIRMVRSAHARLARARSWSAALGPEERERLARVAAMSLAGVVGVAGAWYAWRQRGVGSRGPRAAMPAFYRRALRHVARRGLRPAPGETAREFSGRVGALGPVPARAFARVTALYEATRFGGTPPSAAEMAEAEACVAALRRGAGGPDG